MNRKLLGLKFGIFGLLFLTLCNSAHAKPAINHRQRTEPASIIEIDRIDIEGVTLFTTPVIEDLLEVSPGDSLEQNRVFRTVENLRNMYSNHGYEQVDIRTRLVKKPGPSNQMENVLEFKLNEGDPTRITSIVFLTEDSPEPGFKKFWRSKEKQIRSELKYSSGEIFSLEKLTESKRIIQDILVSSEYIGAKIDAVQVPAPYPGVEKAAKWVQIQFQVNLGEKVSFGFRGNEFFTRGYLDTLVEDQRNVGFGQDYINAIKGRIEEEYKANGFAKVQVAPFTIQGHHRNEKRVTYQITEGPRVKIDLITFEGNSVFSKKELKQKLIEKGPTLIQHGYYVEKEFQKAAELLIEWIKEKGYLSARLITINAIYPPKPKTQRANSTVQLSVYLYEGEQTKVRSLKFKGVHSINEEEVKKLLGVEEKKPLNLFSFSERIEGLKKFYRDLGYLSFRIVNEGSDSVVEYHDENRVADIYLEMEEGPKFKVSRIELDGLVKTHPKIIERELQFQEGKILTEAQMIQTKTRLRRLQIFSSVDIRVLDDPNKSDGKIVRIAVQEADRGLLVLGPGFRNDLGPRLFGQVAYTNLWGENHTAALNVNMNRRFSNYNFLEGQIQFSYLWPYFVDTDMTFRPTVLGGRTQYIDFSADTLTLSLALDKPLLKQINLLASLNYTLEWIDQFNAVQSLVQRDPLNGELRIGSITPKLTLDLRDNSLLPTSGFFASTWLDFSYPYLGSQASIAYYRYQFRTDYHIPLPKGVVWYLSIRGGYEKSFANQTDSNGNVSTASLPLIKQFALGGIGSLRGYAEQYLHVLVPGSATSLSYVNYRTQFDFPFSGSLKLGVFLDAANLLVDTFSPTKDILVGTGFGFHYQTPVGPVNLDWGFKLNPPPGVSLYEVHFSVGII